MLRRFSKRNLSGNCQAKAFTWFILSEYPIFFVIKDLQINTQTWFHFEPFVASCHLNITTVTGYHYFWRNSRWLWAAQHIQYFAIIPVKIRRLILWNFCFKIMRHKFRQFHSHHFSNKIWTLRKNVTLYLTKISWK